MKNLKLFRTQKGWTQAKLAAHMGVVQSVVAEWEGGEMMPSADKLPRLADAMGCSIDALYGREPPPSPSAEAS